MPGPVIDLHTLRVHLAPDARVVLTNGVFDLLHVGHLRYLRQARELGDVLVVGVNADAAVRKPGRPLVPETERAELVAALEPVDYVVIFADATADSLLRTVRPHVYAKGADYSLETLPEAATAREVGARIAFIPLVAGHSTTELANALLPRPDSGHETSAGCSASVS
jgi:rfaE bifunctional protein nucleotidyltransferase chain/domain